MKAVILISNPDSVELELNLTMTLHDWKRLRAQLVGDYPSWKMSSLISAMVIKAEKQFVEAESFDL